jgi:SAM-dependent methyltransferase
MSNFNKYSAYYDLLYKDKNYEAESDYVSRALRNSDASINHLLELGCGSGNHAKYLTNFGFEVTGIERSPQMIEEAKTKNIQNFTAILGDITRFDLNKKFDAAISLFHVISYVTDNDALINCFKNVYNHLNPNGVFLFDVWFTPAVYSQKPSTKIRRLENSSLSITRIAESTVQYTENIVNVNFEVHILDKATKQLDILHETHPMRHFSIPELKLLATLSGFELIHCEEFLSHESPSDKTWGVCIIFKKK